MSENTMELVPDNEGVKSHFLLINKGLWECKECSQINCNVRIKGGLSNLKSHLLAKHSEFCDVLQIAKKPRSSQQNQQVQLVKETSGECAVCESASRPRSGLSMTESHRGHIHTVPRSYLRIKFIFDGCKVALENILKYNFSLYL